MREDHLPLFIILPVIYRIPDGTVKRKYETPKTKLGTNGNGSFRRFRDTSANIDEIKRDVGAHVYCAPTVREARSVPYLPILKASPPKPVPP